MSRLRLAIVPAVAALVLGAAAVQAQGFGPGYGTGPGYGAGPGMMMGPGYGMGPGMMMDRGYGMGPGMMMGPGYGMGQGFGPMMGQGFGPGPALEIEARDVERMLQRHVALMGNPRLQVGAVREADEDTITAEIVTAQEGALVDRLEVDRRTGAIRRIE